MRQAGLEERVELREMGAAELDTAFPDERFDCITSSLVFSELSPDEMDFTLRQCHRLLAPGGRLVIIDEVLPDSLAGRLGSLLLRVPFAILTFILTQSTTRRVANVLRETGLDCYLLVAPTKGINVWCAAALGLSLLLDFDFEGQSPLYAGATITYWAVRRPRVLDWWARMGFEIEPFFAVSVDADRCRGCGTCVDVCPKGVYELYRLDGKKRSHAVDSAACEQCTACVKQCPESAALAEPPICIFKR